MKKILSTALAIVLFVSASQAQEKQHKGEHHGHKKEASMQHLNLTAEQKARLESIRAAEKKEMQELKKNGQLGKEQRKELHEKYKAQYRAVLTPAQQEELGKRKEDGKDKGQRRKGFNKENKNLGQQAAFFKKELNLSADQETKLKSIFQEFRSKAQDIRSNNSLNQEQKREQLHTPVKQYMEQGKAVLTPEQQRKFEELKNQRKGKRNANV